MKWYTHMAVGANAAWISLLIGGVSDRAPIFMAVGAIAALLPDIDAVTAKIHYVAGGVLGVFKGNHSGIFQHRGFFHSIFATILATIVAYLGALFVFKDVDPLFPIIFGLGYFSHPLIDALNTSVGYLFPFYNKRFNIVPRIFRSKVGGPADQILFVLGILFAVGFLLLNIQFFAPTSRIFSNFDSSGQVQQ